MSYTYSHLVSPSTICGVRVRVELSNGKVRPKPWDRRGGPSYGSRRNFDPNDKCYECGERGHYAYDCRNKRGSRSSRRRYVNDVCRLSTINNVKKTIFGGVKINKYNPRFNVVESTSLLQCIQLNLRSTTGSWCLSNAQECLQ